MTSLSTTSDVHIPLGMEVRRVKIRKYPVSALAASVRADYEAKFGEPPAEPGGWYHRDDWHRVSYVAEVLRPGGDLLDVGAGAGQFLNMLARSGKFRSVVGIDKAKFKKYTELEPNMSKLDGNIANLQFEDDSFDVVTCMEVLEHIPPEVFVAGLAELRRVCRGQLIMSVPFCEPEPLSKTHVRRFEAPDILEIFPNATYTLLDRPRMPWIIMEERFDGTSPDTDRRTARQRLGRPPMTLAMRRAVPPRRVGSPPEPQSGTRRKPDRTRRATCSRQVAPVTARLGRSANRDGLASLRSLSGWRAPSTGVENAAANPRPHSALSARTRSGSGSGSSQAVFRLAVPESAESAARPKPPFARGAARTGGPRGLSFAAPSRVPARRHGRCTGRGAHTHRSRAPGRLAYAPSRRRQPPALALDLRDRARITPNGQIEVAEKPGARNASRQPL